MGTHHDFTYIWVVVEAMLVTVELATIVVNVLTGAVIVEVTAGIGYLEEQNDCAGG